MNDNKFHNVEQRIKDIFKESFVAVQQVDNPDIRHIYTRHNLTGEEIKGLQEFYKILFVSQVYDEERKQKNFDAILVILVTEDDS